MIPTSFRTRSVIFAYLFGPPRVITRQEGVAVYDGVCKALGVDDLTFKYAATPAAPGSEIGSGPADPSRGFAIQIERRLGRGSFKVSIDNANMASPVRLLVEYLWPPSREHVIEEFDAVSEAIFPALGGGWQRVMAETRIRGQMEAQGSSAVTFLTDRCLRLNATKLNELEAPVAFASLTLETPPGDPTEEDQLHQPKREIKFEVLREDPRSIYVELMSQWQQLAITPAPDGTVEIDQRRIRRLDDSPSVYLKNTLEFLTEKAIPLFSLAQG